MDNQMSTFFENKTRVYITLVLVPFCLYFKSLFFEFSPMDDQWMVIKNADVLSDWKNINLFFTNPLVGLYYRPLFSVSLMFDFQIGKTTPFIYHFSNLTFHLISVILLYKLFLNLKVSAKTSFLLTLIFSVHPVLLHAVAWIPGRNDVLLTIFILSASIYLIKFFIEDKNLHLFLHFFFFFAAMLTKENACVVPLFFAVLAYNFKSSKKQSIKLILIWIITLACWFILRNMAVKSTLSIGPDVFESIKKFGMGLLIYIGKSIIPIQQSIFPTLKNSGIIAGFISLSILIVIFLKFGVKNKILAISGLVIFFSMISIPVWYGATGSSGEHYEHRIYLPLIGLLLFVSQINFNQTSHAFTYMLYAIALVFALKTFFRMNVYKTEMSFIDAGLKEAPDYYLFYAIKADKLLEQQNYAASIPYYNSAINMQPTRPQLYSARGYAYNEIGNKEGSISDFTKAIEITQNNADMYLNRCLAYKKFGEYENAAKDLAWLKKNAPKTIPPGLEEELNKQVYDLLEQKINKRISADPKNAVLYVERAKILLYKDKPDEALADLKHACELEPGNTAFKTYLDQLSSRVN
ncbi:MAG: hypothetical protein V4677_18405 [Bacteroidota bacterium]